MNITNLRHSVFIWFFTNLIGAFGLWIILNMEIPFYALILVSLILSIPAIVLLIPALYILEFIDGAAKRITFSLTATLGICAVILMVLMAIVSDDNGIAAEIGQMTLPYVVAAPLCFITTVEISITRRLKS
jgi:hypothetical protein